MSIFKNKKSEYDFFETKNNNEFIENDNPFEEAQIQEEKPKKPKKGKFLDRLANQSISETQTTALIAVITFLASSYIITALFQFAYFASKNIRMATSYVPWRSYMWLWNHGTFQIMLCVIILSAVFAYGAATAYMKHLKFIENDRVIRSKSGAYGDSDWMNNEATEMKETFDISNDLSHPGYIPLGVYKNRVYSVPENPTHKQFKNQNICVIGGSGSGKSYAFIGPLILGRIEYQESFVVTDTKGDLYRTYGKLCEKSGYNVLVFNTNDFKHSDSWDCLEDASTAAETEIYEYIDRISNTFIRNTSNGEKDDYWQKNEHDLLRCLLHLVCRDSQYEGRRTFESLIELINSEEATIKTALEASEEKVQHAARSYLSATDAKLRENFRSGLANRLQIYRTPMIARALSEKGIDMEDAVHRKTAIFVITKDTETTYDAITSLFITSLYIKLCEISNSRQYKGKLMSPFWFIIDELCNMAAIEDLSRKISTNRSRKINFCLAIQSISQLDVKYPKLASNILANCGIVPFYGCDDLTTARYVSDRAGSFTQETVSDSAERNKYLKKIQPIFHVRESRSEHAKKLIEISDASQFPSGKVVDLIIGKHPFRGKSYGQDMHWLFAETEPAEAADRNPEWYERFLAEHPEMQGKDEKYYNPSELELQGRGKLTEEYFLKQKSGASKRKRSEGISGRKSLSQREPEQRILSSDEIEAAEENRKLSQNNEDMLRAQINGQKYEPINMYQKNIEKQEALEKEKEKASKILDDDFTENETPAKSLSDIGDYEEIDSDSEIDYDAIERQVEEERMAAIEEELVFEENDRNLMFDDMDEDEEIF